MEKKYVLLLVLLVFIASGAFYKQIYTPKSITNNSVATETAVDAQNDSTATQQRGDTSTPTATNKSNRLDLSGKGLEKLPSYVLKLTYLEELNISNNKITGALQAEIHDLKNLKVLNASNNLMTGVPAEVGQLKNLEVLNLSNNKLTGLPNELGNLKNLKQLNLSGNDYSEQDLDGIKKALPSGVEIIL